MSRRKFNLILIGLVLCYFTGCTQQIPGRSIESENQISELQQSLDNAENENKKLQGELNTLREKESTLADENQQLKAELESLKRVKEASELHGLVRIMDLDDSIVIELRYASKNNFTGQKIYPCTVGLLSRETVLKLRSANEEFGKKGFRIKVWDAYRPLHVQQILWDVVQDRTYVADPQKGSRHNRGTAVDVTLVDQDGRELEMPSAFDDFTEKASRSSGLMSQEAGKNMEYLTQVMTQCGFTTINSEWWHFDDTNWKDHPLLDVPLELFAD